MSHHESGRRFSFVRLLLAVLLLGGLTTGYVYGKDYLATTKTTALAQPWFASYVDVTATPTYAFQQMGNGATNAVLSFIVASPKDTCTPSWGIGYTMDEANASLSLDPRIARLQQRGGSVAISFGGRDNSELATVCTDNDKLVTAYASVINRYNIDTIDLDLEGTTLSDTVSGLRRAQALSTLQAQFRSQGKHLAIWLTLPATTGGFADNGNAAIAQLLANKVDLAGVNVMTMNYGDSLPAGISMGTAAKDALTSAHRQLGILYKNAGVYLNDATLWSKIGATPMLGQNDVAGEIFTLGDAKELSDFANQNAIGRMSMWSANRDILCGSNFVNLRAVSDSCSGVEQKDGEFAQTLGASFTGTISQNSSAITVSGAAPKQDEIVDDPAHSPYQIWDKNGVYLQGTKVVWRKNVYQSKWWTQGEMPDNPVLQAYQSPWELIGPVLPNDKPVPVPTLPFGTYPEWSGVSIYNAGQRVLFSGIPYQAKWWTQGDSPAAASSNQNSSPWIALTQEQISEVSKGTK
jgi:chitinase